MEDSNFSQLLDQALLADIQEAKAATKAITVKYRYKLPARLAKLIFLRLEQHPSLNDTAQPDNFLRILNVAIISKTSSKYKEAIGDITLEALQHSSGAVRESGRKLVNNFPFMFDFGVEDELNAGEKQFTQFLMTIEALLKKYQPHEIPAHLESIRPSVYKSLALTWHDMIMKYHLWEKLNYQERMVELDIPALYKYEEDNEPEEAFFSIREWRENIGEYFVVSDRGLCETLLAVREQQAIQFLDWALMLLGQEKRKDGILRVARQDDSFELTRILTGMLFEKIDLLKPQPSDERIVSEYQIVARSIQAVDNNVLLRTSSGLSFSRILTSLAEQESWSAKPKSIDLLPLLQVFDRLHSEIDEIVEKIFKPEEIELRDALQHISKPPEPIDYMEYRQVVHYMADWVLQSDHKIVLRKPANQLAAILWALFRDVNPYVIIYGLENASLADFGGWKSVSSLHSAKTDVRFLLEQNMADPSILFISDNFFGQNEEQV